MPATPTSAGTVAGLLATADSLLTAGPGTPLTPGGRLARGGGNGGHGNYRYQCQRAKRSHSPPRFGSGFLRVAIS